MKNQSTTNPTQPSWSIATSSRDSRSATLASMGGLSPNRPPSYGGHVRYALGSETQFQFSGVSFGRQVDLLIGSATSYPYYNNINFTQLVDLMITSDQPQNQYRYLQVAPLPSQHYFIIPHNQIVQQFDSATMARKKVSN